MGDPLRALFVNEGALGPGVMGHVRAGDVLRRQLTAHDVRARFVSLPPFGPVARNATRAVPVLGQADLDLHTTRWHVTQSLRARRAIGRALAEGPADAMHVHSHTISLLSTDHMRRVPTLLSLDATVWQWHEMAIWRPVHAHSRVAVGPSLALERRALSAAAAVLAFSGWCRRAAEAIVPRARVVEHHPGIDLQTFRPAARRLPRPRPRVLFVGGRFAEKGGEDLLAALGPLAGRELDLDIVTPEPVRERDGVRVHRLGPSDPALLELFQQADVFCLPTHGDAVPFAVLEAMACGTPVVATAVGAIEDMLDGGRAGILVRPGDRRGLAEAVRALISDPQVREELGATARERCEQRFDAVRQTMRLIELMRDVTTGPTARAA